jgi:DNA topoisomerase-1
LKIVSDREKEITSFKPTEKVVEDEYKKLEKATFIVNKVNRKEKSVKANHPFDTSSLQTTASTIFSWPVKRTSQSAQKLYEKGVITYIRTDSYKISKEAVKAVRELITSNLGDSYLPDKQNVFKKAKGNNQEAHECIRPTKQEYTGSDLTGDEQKLYQLIRARFIACQMAPMLVDTVNYDIKASSKHKLIAKGQSIKFDGWSKIYTHVSTKNKMLPAVSEGETLDLNKLSKVKGATKPPPRYNEGSLVKKMEEESVGRPSTYASIMENIQKREYVKKLDRKGVLGATELGIKVSDYLADHFNDFIMNIKYTAMLEEKLDIIEAGEDTYLKVVQETYDLMMKMVVEAKGNVPQIKGTAVCSVCKKGTVIERGGKWGTFYACDQYPTCKTTYTLSEDGKLAKKEAKSLDKSKPCPECKKVKRKGFLQKRKNNKQNSFFYGCNQYPKCKHTESDAMDGFNI